MFDPFLYHIALAQVFYLAEPLDVSMDTSLHGTIAMVRQEKNKRLYNLRLESKVDDLEGTVGVYEIPWEIIVWRIIPMKSSV